MEGEFEIFGKIHVDDILQLKRGAARDACEAIEDRHFDFVLCDKTSLAPVCVIQLYDRGGEEPDPLTLICEGVGLPLLRLSIHMDYPMEVLRDSVRKAMVKEPFYLIETDGRKEPRISNINDMKF